MEQYEEKPNSILRVTMPLKNSDFHEPIILIRHAFARHNYLKRMFGFDNKLIYCNQLLDP